VDYKILTEGRLPADLRRFDHGAVHSRHTDLNSSFFLSFFTDVRKSKTESKQMNRRIRWDEEDKRIMAIIDTNIAKKISPHLQ
jgi:hypothetical protein